MPVVYHADEHDLYGELVELRNRVNALERSANRWAISTDADGDTVIAGDALITGDFSMDNANPTVSGHLFFRTGDSSESFPGHVRASVQGSGAARRIQVSFEAPTVDTTDSLGAFFTLQSQSVDDTTDPPGMGFHYDGLSSQVPEVTIDNGMIFRMFAGSTAFFDDVFMNSTVSFESSGRALFDPAAHLIIPLVSGTPAGVSNGEVWIDSVANEFRVREGGVTRTVGSW